MRSRMGARTQDDSAWAELSASLWRSRTHCPARRGLGPAGVSLHSEEGENSFLWKPGPLALRTFSSSPQFSYRHGLQSSFTMLDRGYMRWGKIRGKHSRFSGSHGVFQRATGRHNEERRGQACTIPTVVLRGERRGTELGAPKLDAGAWGTLPSFPEVGTGAADAGTKGAQGRALQRPLARGRSHIRGGSWVKIKCGVRGAEWDGVRSLFGASCCSMSPALGPPPPLA